MIESAKTKPSSGERRSPRGVLYDVFDVLATAQEVLTKPSGSLTESRPSGDYEFVDASKTIPTLEEETRVQMGLSTARYRAAVQEPLKELRSNADGFERRSNIWSTFFKLLSIVFSVFIVVGSTANGVIASLNNNRTEAIISFTIAAVQTFRDLLQPDRRGISMKNASALFARIKSRLVDFYLDPLHDPQQFRTFLKSLYEDYERATTGYSNLFAFGSTTYSPGTAGALKVDSMLQEVRTE